MEMVFPKIKITAAEQRGEYRYHTLGAIFGRKVIQALDTAFLLDALDPRSPNAQAIVAHMGKSTNPYWVTAEVAEELCFNRNALSVQQYDVFVA